MGKDAYSKCLNGLSAYEAKHVDLFDPTIKAYAPAYNPVYLSENDNIDKKVDSRTGHMESQYSKNEWSGNIGYIHRNAFHLLFSNPEAVLLDIRKVLSEGKEGNLFREESLRYVKNPEVHKFWTTDFPNMDKSVKRIALRKLTAFFVDSRVQNIFSIKENKFDMERIMNSGRINLCTFSEGSIGAHPAGFLAGCLFDDINSAAKSRNEWSEEERKLHPVSFYFDEFFRSAPKAFESAVVALRKYEIWLTLSYHFEEQLSDELKAGLRNLGSVIALKQSYRQAKNHAHPQFLGKVDSNEFMTLQPGEGFGMTPDSGILKFKSRYQEGEGYESDVAKRIIQRNLETNYVKIEDIEKARAEKEHKSKTKERKLLELGKDDV